MSKMKIKKDWDKKCLECEKNQSGQCHACKKFLCKCCSVACSCLLCIFGTAKLFCQDCKEFYLYKCQTLVDCQYNGMSLECFHQFVSKTCKICKCNHGQGYFGYPFNNDTCDKCQEISQEKKCQEISQEKKQLLKKSKISQERKQFSKLSKASKKIKKSKASKLSKASNKKNVTKKTITITQTITQTIRIEETTRIKQYFQIKKKQIKKRDEYTGD